MSNFWKRFKEEKPICTKSGEWDGLKSEQILFCDVNGYYFVGICYEGFLDGSIFFDVYDENGFEVPNNNIAYWAYIPMLM